MRKNINIFQEGEGMLGKYEAVNVPPYSEEEFESCLRFYRDSGLFLRGIYGDI